jgi:Spy/CpxP family protein refolding chaperone
MKAQALLVVVALTLGLTNSGLAQTPPPDDSKTIFAFKSQLGLSDDQETKLKALLYDERATVTADDNKLKTLGQDLGKLVDQKADMQAIRAKLEEISKIQVDASCLNIEDSRKVESILSADQLAKWKDIQKQFAAQTKN